MQQITRIYFSSSGLGKQLKHEDQELNLPKMEAKTLTLMQTDNHIKGHQIRIAALLNTFSTGTLICHKPGKDFFYYVTFVCIPGTSFALLSRSKKVE